MQLLAALALQPLQMLQICLTYWHYSKDLFGGAWHSHWVFHMPQQRTIGTRACSYLVMCGLRLKAKSQAKPGSLWARPSRAIGTGPPRALAWPEKLKSQSRRPRPGLLSRGFVDHRTSAQPHILTTVAKNRLESPKVAICPCESMQELLALTCKCKCQPWLYSGRVTLQCCCGSPFPFPLSKTSQLNAHSHSNQNTC
jgi:hypothetical protein